MMTSDDILSELDRLAPGNYNHVTISGGNPLLNKGLEGFVEAAKARGVRLAIETQGTKFQPWLPLIDEVTISPKPPSSGMNTDFTKLEYMMANLEPQQFNLKVVVFDDNDFDYAKMVHNKYPDAEFYLQVGNPYLGERVEAHTEKLLQRYENLVDKVMNDKELQNVRVLPQLHTLLWSNKQGV